MAALDPKCGATTKEGQPCPLAARHGAFCWRHDPAQADRRRAVGRIRHTRFVDGIGGQQYDKAKVPTVARLVDRMLDLERELAGIGPVRVDNAKAVEARVKVVTERRNLLTEARDTLWGDRDRLHRGILDPASPNVIVPDSEPEAPAWLRPVPQ